MLMASADAYGMASSVNVSRDGEDRRVTLTWMSVKDFHVRTVLIAPTLRVLSAVRVPHTISVFIDC